MNLNRCPKLLDQFKAAPTAGQCGTGASRSSSSSIGNSVAAVVISKWSGEFTEKTVKLEYNRVLGRSPEAAL